MPKDLREFISVIEEEFPEELLRVKAGPLDPAEGECVALLHHLMRQGKRPMAVFEQVKTLKDEPWPGSVVFQTAGTWTKIGAGLGMTRETMDFVELEKETSRRLTSPIAPERIDERDAPVKAQVRANGEVDLFDLPAYIQNEKDARPGNLSGVVVARDPETGRYNISWQRQRVLAPDRLVPSINPHRHLMQIVQKYRARGADRVPVAQVFGHHVLFGLGASFPVGYEVEDEYALVGGIMGEPVRVTPSATWGDELLIPADAEMVLEGYISTTETESGGLWGDYMRYYVPQHDGLVMRPTALNMRDRPIVEHVWVGQYAWEDVSWSCLLRNMIAARFPKVGAVNIAAPLTVIVQLKSEHPGDAGRVAAIVHSWGHLVKHVVIVDEDVDPFDMGEVMWAIGTRVDANRGVFISPNLTAAHMDPSAQKAFAANVGVGGLVIDTTRPPGEPYLEVAYPKRETLEQMRPDRWLSQADIDRLAAGNTTRSWAKV